MVLTSNILFQPDKGGAGGKNKPEYWAKGTGYGHHYRSGKYSIYCKYVTVI